jgi:hypothetical protein
MHLRVQTGEQSAMPLKSQISMRNQFTSRDLTVSILPAAVFICLSLVPSTRLTKDLPSSDRGASCAMTYYRKSTLRISYDTWRHL